MQSKLGLPLCLIHKRHVPGLFFSNPGRTGPQQFRKWTLLILNRENCLFVLITVSRRAPDKEALPSPYHYCSLLLWRRYHLTSKELLSAYFDLETYTVITHQRIPLLLAKSALSCWMYPSAQTTISPTPSHPWVPSEWPYCQKAQCGCWFTVKHSKAGLQTSSHPQNSASHMLWLQGP